MPFGVKAAGFNSTTLKKLKKFLDDKEIFSCKTLSTELDIEYESVLSHMNYLGYKNSGEKMSKSAHEEFVAGLEITKRSNVANEMEEILSKSEVTAEQIQSDQAREAAAKAELAEIQLAEIKSGKKGAGADSKKATEAAK